MNPGVRERKKAQTQQVIYEAALELFSEKGFNETKIEDIAERALVGVGTVYNYFGSKRGLLMELSHRTTKNALEYLETVLENPGDDPEVTIVDSLWTMMAVMFEYDRKLMRELFIAALSDPEGVGDGLMEDDMRILQSLGKLISVYQERGNISKELPVEQAVMVIYSSLIMIFHLYMAMEKLDKKTLKKTLRDYIHIIFLGWSTPAGDTK